MKAIIFGIKGQDGYFLSKLLKEKKVEVIGISTTGNNCIIGDVSDFDFVKKIIKEHQPDYIFDFAAISSTSHEVIFENYKTIENGTINILEGVRLYSPKTRVFLSGSALQFKNSGKPINEKTPFEASSAYSASRIASTYMARYYRKKFRIKVYIGYFFNHDSILRTEQHINKKISEAIKRIDSGSTEKIEIGDLNVKKEFNFAGDIVEAIWLLVNQEHLLEVVIGSGKAYSIKKYIIDLFKIINKDWKKYVVIKEEFKSEYRVLVSDPKLIKSLGWKPKTSFSQIIHIMLTSDHRS